MKAILLASLFLSFCNIEVAGQVDTIVFTRPEFMEIQDRERNIYTICECADKDRKRIYDDNNNNIDSCSIFVLHLQEHTAPLQPVKTGVYRQPTYHVDRTLLASYKRKNEEWLRYEYDSNGTLIREDRLYKDPDRGNDRICKDFAEDFDTGELMLVIDIFYKLLPK